MIWTEVVRGLVEPVDGDELSFEFPAEDPGAPVAGDACDRASAQRAVDVDRAAGDDLRARRNGAQHRHVAIHVLDGLAGADGPFDRERAAGRARDGVDRFRVRLGRQARHLDHPGGLAAADRGRQAEPGHGGIRAFERHDADAALMQVGHQSGDLALADLEIGDVDDHRAPGEKAGGLREDDVEFVEPALKRDFRRQHERQK